jgi:hypothetical protein
MKHYGMMEFQYVEGSHDAPIISQQFNEWADENEQVVKDSIKKT